jgi:hypothetical protein
MLRFVKFDPLRQRIYEFCCSRVVFCKVNVAVPNIKLLFDNDFILSNLKKYRRVGGEELITVRGVCGKCDGYGYLDWITRLRTEEGVDEEMLWRSLSPIPVKNENPIISVFAEEYNAGRILIYYPSAYDESEMQYRCDQCRGTGMADNTSHLREFTVEEFLEFYNYKPPKPTEPKKTTGFLDFLGSLIFKGGKHDEKIQDSPNS